MLKKNTMFTWIKDGKVTFEEIKVAVFSTPTLINPNFEKDFILYTLGGESSISTILTQENDENKDKLLPSLLKGLRNVKKNVFM